MTTDKSQAEAPFEQQLVQLEEIVSKLEDESVGLEEALKLFEEGMGLASSCRKRLESVEARVRELLADGSTVDLDLDD